MLTTLNRIRAHGPCVEGWEKLLRHLGKTQSDDEPLNIATILDSNGLDDALWCLRAVDGCDREIRLFAVWCARQVHHFMTDPRSKDAIDIAERYADGRFTAQELQSAQGVAFGVSRDVAWGATHYAAQAAAWTTRDVAWGAAKNAAWAAREAAWAAAKDATWAAREAAWIAAWGAQAAELKRICLNFPIATNQMQMCANG